MIVIAVLHAHIHPRLGHPARDLPELSRLILPQPQRDHIALFDHLNARRNECLTRRTSVVEEKVGDADAVGDEHATPFDAHSRTAKRFAHVGESAGTIVEMNGQVFHVRISAWW